MLRYLLNGTKAAAIGWLVVLFLFVQADGQTKRRVTPKPDTAKTPASKADEPAVKVTLVDEAGFRKLLIPNGKPLMINFWATWCDPCREEFPDLVKFDNEFKGKIDFITVSLDDPDDIATTVPKFLASMKADMPAYLLKAADESAVISSVSRDWRGGMPFTVLYAPNGNRAYFREGKVVLETLRGEVNKLIQPAAAPAGKGSLAGTP